MSFKKEFKEFLAWALAPNGLVLQELRPLKNSWQVTVSKRSGIVVTDTIKVKDLYSLESIDLIVNRFVEPPSMPMSRKVVDTVLPL